MRGRLLRAALLAVFLYLAIRFTVRLAVGVAVLVIFFLYLLRSAVS